MLLSKCNIFQKLKILWHCNHADDIAITCDTIDQTEHVIRRLEMNALEVGLKINLKNEDHARWPQFSAEFSYNDKRIYSRNLQ